MKEGKKEGRKEGRKERMPRLPTFLSHIPQNGNVPSDNVELSVVRTTVPVWPSLTAGYVSDLISIIKQ
jgi:hypothetical protein